MEYERAFVENTDGWRRLIAADGGKRVRENSGQRQCGSRCEKGTWRFAIKWQSCVWDGLFAEVDISFRACFFSAWGGQFKPGMGATALKSGLTLTITAPAIGAPRRPMADGP